MELTAAAGSGQTDQALVLVRGVLGAVDHAGAARPVAATFAIDDGARQACAKNLRDYARCRRSDIKTLVIQNVFERFMERQSALPVLSSYTWEDAKVALGGTMAKTEATQVFKSDADIFAGAPERTQLLRWIFFTIHL